MGRRGRGKVNDEGVVLRGEETATFARMVQGADVDGVGKENDIADCWNRSIEESTTRTTRVPLVRRWEEGA
jgi:hypothetical protein